MLAECIAANPNDASIMNPFLEEAESKLARARANASAAPAPTPATPAGAPAPNPAPPPHLPLKRDRDDGGSSEPPSARGPGGPPGHGAPASDDRHAPPPAAASAPKAAKHDWGAGARARAPGGDSDAEDDIVRVERAAPPARPSRPSGRSLASASPPRRGGADAASARAAAREANRDRARRAAAAGVSSFVSAGERLDAENARMGLPPGSRRASGSGDPEPSAHRSRGRAGRGAGGDENSGDDENERWRAPGPGSGGNQSVARNGFIPPYVRKAFAGPSGGNGAGGGVGGGGHRQRQKPPSGGGGVGGGSGDGGGDDSEAPFSDATMRRLCPDGGPVPEHFLKMDRDVVERVCSEILERPADVSWDTIAGLRHAKAAVQELAVWPLMKPELFRGARAVPKGLLLFGPPGTGKTLIGRAVASQCGATFFSISASSLTSKWIGEGEKMVRALFAVAARCEPAIIFVDEIDSLLSARKSDGEHESSRRMKTEFLVQMDGLGNSEGPGGEEARLLLIGATNRPQELDDGARRRLAKQLYIPLPCAAARRAIVTNILGADASVKHALSDADLDKVVEKTEGYSGSDMKHLVQEAARAPLRELFKRSAARADARGEDPRDGDARGAVPGADAPSPSAMRPIKLVDFKRASKQVRPSVTDADIRFHEEWNRKHGASSAADAEDDEGEEDDEW